MQLSIIIVNTNECRVLRICLQSIYRQSHDIDFEVIVVDNASTDGTKEMLEGEFPQVHVVRNSENLGFAAANNRAIPYATGNYLLLLNPDTEIRDCALERSLQFMDEHPQVGIGGCKLWFPDGTLQRSVRSFPTVWNIFCETTFLYLIPWFEATSRYTLSTFDYGVAKDVDWVCGACMMIRRDVIDRIGLLDEQFYMYTEEVDYCFRTKLAGYEVWFIPDAEVTHYWGGVSKPTLRVMVWGHMSQMLFFQKHFHGFERYMLIGLKYIGIVLRMVVYFLAGCISMNKQLLSKAYYSLVAAYRLIAKPLRYRHNFHGRVIPWPHL